jgi:hypothetical protein
MAKNDDPDNVQSQTVKGARKTRVQIDSPRDNSSLEVPDVMGNSLGGKGDLSHSIDGCSVASEQ